MCNRGPVHVPGNCPVPAEETFEESFARGLNEPHAGCHAEIAALRAQLAETQEQLRLTNVDALTTEAEANDVRAQLADAVKVVDAARDWYAVQQGTMASVSSTGLTLRDSLRDYDAKHKEPAK